MSCDGGRDSICVAATAEPTVLVDARPPASAASRLVVYSFAALMDVILSSVMFVAMVRAAQMGKSPVSVAALMPIWAIIYMGSSLAAGYLVTRRNASWILILACTLTAALSVGYILAPGFGAMCLLMAIQGCTTAFFFTPFQYFMKLVDEGHRKSLGHSSGLYVFSWSSGYALGPFIAGWLWTWGWQYCHVFNAVTALAIVVGVFAFKHQAEAAPESLPDPPDGAADDPPDPAVRAKASAGSGTRPAVWSASASGGALAPSEAEPGVKCVDKHGFCDLLTHSVRIESGVTAAALQNSPLPARLPCHPPDLAWMAWVFGGLGCLIASLIRSVFPSSGHVYAITEAQQGTTMFALSAVQAIVGLLLSRREGWMYRATPVLAFGVAGLLGLGLFAAARNVGLFYLGAIVFGIYSGFFYFYFVFHSLAHPTRAARYVSINEATVGLAGIIGPLTGGYLAKQVHLSAPYLFCVGLLALGLSAQAWIHYRRSTRNQRTNQ